MIKIIKQGNPNRKVKCIVYKYECPHCRCEFEFEEDDCEYIDYIYKHGEIDCPCCNLHLGIFFKELEKREVEE